MFFRIRMLFAAALTALVVSIATPAPAEAGARKQMVRAVNYVRAVTHRHRVHYSRRLSRSAARWARHLMRVDYLAHSSRAISRGQGEVIEMHSGGRALVRRTVVAWWNSPGHREVMLTRRYHRAGAGRAIGYLNGQRATIWVVRFAR